MKKVRGFLETKYGKALTLATALKDIYPEDSAEVFQMLEDLVTASSDAATESVSRAFFFQRLHDFLKVEYPELTSTGRLFVGPARSYFLVASDFAVLSFFNSISQDEGDRVLARAAAASVRAFIDCWVGRIGGDEFASLVENANKHNIDLAIEEVQKEVSSEPPQWVDLAYSNHDDVLHYLSLVDKDGSYFASMSPSERIPTLANILVGIASYRAQIEKAYKRIGDAITIRADQGEEVYQAYMLHARKGACGVSDEDIKVISEHARGDKEVLSRVCLAYALTAKRKIVLSGEEPGRMVNLLAMFEVAESSYYQN